MGAWQRLFVDLNVPPPASPVRHWSKRYRVAKANFAPTRADRLAGDLTQLCAAEVDANADPTHRSLRPKPIRNYGWARIMESGPIF